MKKFFGDMFKEPGVDKWSLTRVVFFICFIAMLVKTFVTHDFIDLPATWCYFLIGLLGVGKASTWGHQKNTIQAHKDLHAGPQ